MSELTSFNKTLLIVLSSLWLTSVQAETPKAKTLGDMVSQAKRKQELTLNPPPDIKVAAVNKKSLPAEAPVASLPPMLWTLTGVNNHLVAEVIYKQTVHVLHLSQGDREIGPWQVERYGPGGLYLVSSDAKADAKKKNLFLPIPLPGASLERYAAGLPKPLSNTPSKQRDPSNSELAMMMQDLPNIMPSQMLPDVAKAPPQEQPSTPPGLK